MKTKNESKINFIRLIFMVFLSLFLTAVGTAAQAANITGTVSDGLGAYTGGTIYIVANTDPNDSGSTVASTPVTALGTYSIDASAVTNGTPLYISALWDADASGPGTGATGGDPVGFYGGDISNYLSNPVIFNSTSGNSGINITLNYIMVSGAISAGSSGYTQTPNPNIYIGARDLSQGNLLVGIGMITNVGSYLFPVPGSYLNNQLYIGIYWDTDGSGFPNSGDWGGIYASNPITLQIGANNAINIDLNNEYFTISGQVAKAAGGEPVANASVNAMVISSCDGMNTDSFSTDMGGNYSLVLLGGYEYFLNVDSTYIIPSPDLAPEWYTASGGTYYCREAEGITPTGDRTINFALEDGGSISGTVRDNTGAPAAGISVTTYSDGLDFGWKQVTTDSGGNFIFTDLAPGPKEIRIWPEVPSGLVHRNRDYWLNLSQNMNLGTLSLEKGALVTGTLINTSDNPVANLECSFGGKFEVSWSDTDSNGDFQFRLPLGTYVLAVEYSGESGYTMAPIEITVSDVNATHSLGDLTVYDNTSGSYIEGVVTDNAANTGQFAVLTFSSSQQFTPDKLGGLMPLAESQPDLPDPPGNGSYSMFAPPDQTVNIVLALFNEDAKALESMTVVSTPIANQSTASDLSGINFTYNNAGFTVDGYVKDSSSGTGIYKATAILYKQPGDNFAGFAEPDETGHYILYNVPAGDYKIAATHPDYPEDTGLSAQFTVGADKTAPVVFLEEGQTKKFKGDFNGDGTQDILWRNNQTGQVNVWLTNPSSIGVLSKGTLGMVSDINWEIIGVGNFNINTDSKSDLLWRNSQTGQVNVWLVNGTAVLSKGTLGTVSDLAWEIINSGNFNSDGNTDLLWRNSQTGQVNVWLTNPASIGVSSKGTPGTVSDMNWEIIGIGDFNAATDTKTDILWRNNQTGQVNVWLIDGTAKLSSGTLGTVSDSNWEIINSGNFNSGTDSNTDLLWRNSQTGQVNVWLTNPASIGVLSKGTSGTVADMNWDIIGVGNFNSGTDSKTDLLWRNKQTGQVNIWLINGTALSGSGTLGTVSDLAWEIINSGNFNTDSNTDLLWRNSSTGQVNVWLTNPSSIGVSSKGTLGTVADMAWEMQ